MVVRVRFYLAWTGYLQEATGHVARCPTMTAPAGERASGTGEGRFKKGGKRQQLPWPIRARYSWTSKIDIAHTHTGHVAV